MLCWDTAPAQPLPAAPGKLDSAGLQYEEGTLMEQFWRNWQWSNCFTLESSVKQRGERRSVLQRPPKTDNFPISHHWSHANSYRFLLWGWILWKSKAVETLPHSSKHTTVSLRVKCRAAGWLSSQHPGFLWRHPFIPTSFSFNFLIAAFFF